MDSFYSCEPSVRVLARELAFRLHKRMNVDSRINEGAIYGRRLEFILQGITFSAKKCIENGGYGVVRRFFLKLSLCFELREMGFSCSFCFYVIKRIFH